LQTKHEKLGHLFDADEFEADERQEWW
jgi:hypothetical protein